jgi:hypothetical protein
LFVVNAVKCVLTFWYACCLSSVQCGCYKSVVELVLFYIWDWSVCAAIWCSVFVFKMGLHEVSVVSPPPLPHVLSFFIWYASCLSSMQYGCLDTFYYQLQQDAEIQHYITNTFSIYLRSLLCMVMKFHSTLRVHSLLTAELASHIKRILLLLTLLKKYLFSHRSLKLCTNVLDLFLLPLR